jgi:hypothetical protein
MMTIENVRRANELLGSIEKNQRLIGAYREAAEVIVGTGRTGPYNIDHMITLPSAEIGDHVIAALERRVTEMRAELQQLGVE